jgi:hypothetical protein
MISFPSYLMLHNLYWNSATKEPKIQYITIQQFHHSKVNVLVLFRLHRLHGDYVGIVADSQLESTRMEWSSMTCSYQSVASNFRLKPKTGLWAFSLGLRKIKIIMCFLFNIKYWRMEGQAGHQFKVVHKKFGSHRHEVWWKLVNWCLQYWYQ